MNGIASKAARGLRGTQPSGVARARIRSRTGLYDQMFKLAVVPFNCLLVLRDNGEETQYPHSFMAEIQAGTRISCGRTGLDRR